MLAHHLNFAIHRSTPVHLGVTGSVAAYKSAEILRMLLQVGLDVSVTLTSGAAKFVSPLLFESLGASAVYTSLWDTPDSAFGHLEPAQKTKAMLVAPATANTLAKMAHGIADEILSTQYLAFQGPVLVAPTMNPRLFEASATQDNLALLQKRGVKILEPESGEMACGETGRGRLPNLEYMVIEVLRALTVQDMAGTHVLVTLGPTQEFFDPVRYWTNPSTGLMGACLAMAAWLRGAKVSVVHGPVDLWFPPDVARVPVVSARQMYEACIDLWPTQDIGLMSAAVSDFSPVPFTGGKFKKRDIQDGDMRVAFTSNPDILRTLGENKAPGQKLLGFCAETGNLEHWASFKLQEKHCDLMVANSVTAEGSGFAVPTNIVYVLDAKGRNETWPTLSKSEIGWRLMEWMTQLLD
ncbi:bifunctional phosphopantothenoylcysteine decarboxylase/phosphopantothenate--cysteine ligase CoaBC [Fundidesulfovibrio butyratiphilus]